MCAELGPLQNRIQKLLCCEYQEFNELVLIESSFAQTTRDGNGIRQVQIGLTPDKLVMAVDNLSDNTEPEGRCEDPEIECLELLAIVPLQAVTMSVFRRRTRNTIKAHFCNGRILFFELAVARHREMFWNLWCDKLRMLAPDSISSTQSETSIGSSSSSLTNYIRIDGSRDLWQERDLYLGRKLEMTTAGKKAPSDSRGQFQVLPDKQVTVQKRVFQVNRFGAGISENCLTSLYLPAQVIVAQALLQDINDFLKGEEEESSSLTALEEKAEMREQRSKMLKHPRRYGLATMPHLMSGLGLWALSPPQAFLAQMRKWSSEVTLATRDSAVSTGIPKRLLVSTISSESLLRYNKQHSPPLVFWTPGLWYKPRMVCGAYSQQREHISVIRATINDGGRKKKWYKNETIFKGLKKKQAQQEGWGDVQVKKMDLRSQLVADIALSSWDFDSTLIAYQITLIDRDLFIRVSSHELKTLLTERNARNTPNFRALVAFSNRLANLISSEVIRIDSVKMRARLVARWINVTDKLFRLQDMQGVRTVLSGLQSAGVYRLTGTWAHLRHHHNSKYRRMSTLMKLNRDPRSERYMKMMCQVVKTTPYMLSAEYMVAVMLGWTAPPNPLLQDQWTVEDLLNTWSTAATEYGLTETPLVREFLTKARYVEELDNFILASQLEPTMHLPSQ